MKSCALKAQVERRLSPVPRGHPSPPSASPFLLSLPPLPFLHSLLLHCPLCRWGANRRKGRLWIGPQIWFMILLHFTKRAVSCSLYFKSI